MTGNSVTKDQSDALIKLLAETEDSNLEELARATTDHADGVPPSLKELRESAEGWLSRRRESLTKELCSRIDPEDLHKPDLEVAVIVLEILLHLADAPWPASVAVPTSALLVRRRIGMMCAATWDARQK